MFDIPGSSCLDASNFHNSVTCRLESEKSLTRGNAHFVFLPVIIESLRLSPNLWSANCFLCRHPIRNDPPAMSDNHDELESNSCKADFIHSSVIRAGVSFRLFFLKSPCTARCIVSWSKHTKCVGVSAQEERTAHCTDFTEMIEKQINK